MLGGCSDNFIELDEGHCGRFKILSQVLIIHCKYLARYSHQVRGLMDISNTFSQGYDSLFNNHLLHFNST